MITVSSIVLYSSFYNYAELFAVIIHLQAFFLTGLVVGKNVGRQLPMVLIYTACIYCIVAIPTILAKKDFIHLSKQDHSSYVVKSTEMTYFFNKKDRFIGKVDKYAFLYFQDRIMVLPVSEIKYISHD